MTLTTETKAQHQVHVADHEYYREGDKALLARVYQPDGVGPFPAVIDVHGGGWVNADRLNNVEVATALARNGIVVVSLDFRMPPEAAYPASLADINLGIRWLKAHAKQFQAQSDRVGGFGTSSGGHQILLAAMRPHDPRYTALALPDSPRIDAELAYVISAYGVLDPLARYHLVKQTNNAPLVRGHDLFWGTEAAMSEGSPVLILERGEKVSLPPALILQGSEEEYTPRTTAEGFVQAYRKAGGQIRLGYLEGEKHLFLRDKPAAPKSLEAIQMIADFIKTSAGTN